MVRKQCSCGMSLNGGGYDILKYFMALLIIAIHSKAFYGDFCYIYIYPLTTLAVPVFFVLSSLFYFRKIILNGFDWHILGNFVLRISLLYVFWFIVNLPIIIMEKQYFIHSGIINEVCRFVMDVLFRYTYYGSWFLSSLIMAIVIITLSLYHEIIKVIVLFFSFLLLFYIHMIEQLPISTHFLYDWVGNNIRQEVQLTFMESLPWVSMGYMLASLITKTNKFRNYLNNRLVLFVFIMTSAGLMIYGTINDVTGLVLTSRIICVMTMVLFAGSLSLSSNNICLHLRKLSVLFFMIHFEVLYYMSIFTRHFFHSSIQDLMGYLPTFFLVVVLTYFFSETILYLKNKKFFRFFNYSY